MTLPTPKGERAVIWSTDEQPEPVSPSSPLVGLERRVLENWLENSRNVRQAHKRSPLVVENAVRQAVWTALTEELKMRSEGMPQHQAEEFTRPQMWAPPTFPTT